MRMVRINKHYLYYFFGWFVLVFLFFVPSSIFKLLVDLIGWWSFFVLSFLI